MHTQRTIRIAHDTTFRDFLAASLEETEKIARELAVSLHGGEVIALSGELGAGKTTFVQYMAHILGVREPVTSPTFVVMNVYDVPKKKDITKLCHIDAYRLSRGFELENVGVGDYLSQSFAVTIIEWPEHVAEILPKSTLRVEILYVG